MTWEYRIIHHDNEGHPYFAIHEVFYDNHGKITNWTADPIDVAGETQPELIATLKQMLRDAESEVLVESQLEKAIHGIL
jgi:hypothetical protein